MTDYFCGQFLCELTCLACNNKSISFNNFTDISLSFSGNAYSAVDVVDMIKEFLRPEDIQDSCCAKEKRVRPLLKKM